MYTKKKAASTHSLDQYKNESCTAKKKSLVREAILKFSENPKSDGAKAFAPPEAECKDKNILKNVKNYETKPNLNKTVINPCNPPTHEDPVTPKIPVIDKMPLVKPIAPHNQTMTMKPNQEGGSEKVKTKPKPDPKTSETTENPPPPPQPPHPAPLSKTKQMLLKTDQEGGSEIVKPAMKGGGETPELVETETKTFKGAKPKPNQDGKTKPEGEENFERGGATHHSRLNKKKSEHPTRTRFIDQHRRKNKPNPPYTETNPFAANFRNQTTTNKH